MTRRAALLMALLFILAACSSSPQSTTSSPTPGGSPTTVATADTPTPPAGTPAPSPADTKPDGPTPDVEPPDDEPDRPRERRHERPSILKIPVEDEIKVGREASERYEQDVQLMSGEPLDRVKRIGEKITAATGRTDLPFEFKVVDAEDINAITFPGGFVYVYRGLLDEGLTDDQLAGVLGHEVVHATKSHAFKRLFPIYMARRITKRLTGRELENAVTQVMEMLTMNGVGRRLELEADAIGVEFAKDAGFDPHGLLGVLEIFERLEGRSPGRLERLTHSHPPPRDRIKKLTPIVEELSKQ